MIEGWKEYKLDNIGAFKNGANFSSDKMGSGIPLVNVKDVTDSPLLHPERMDLVDLDVTTKSGEAYLAKEGDIFFVRSSVKREGVGAVGMLKNNESQVVHCGFVIRFRITSKEILPRFAFYLFNTSFNREKVRNVSGGTTIVNVSQGSLKMLKFNFPPLQTQRKIASILSAYDDLIENNLKRIKLLEEKAQLTYEEWFVRMKFPGHETTPIDQESGLPEGWEEKTIEDIYTKLESGKRPKGGIDKELKHGFASIGAENVNGIGRYDYSKEKYVTEDFFKTIKKGLLEHKDILIYKDGAYIGKTSMFQDNFPHPCCAVNEHVFLLNTGDEILQNYLYFTLETEDYYKKMQGLNSNAAQPGINQKKLKTIELIIPSDDLLKAFSDLTEPIAKSIMGLSKQNQLLKEARDILLPRLMTGMIDVEQVKLETLKPATA